MKIGKWVAFRESGLYVDAFGVYGADFPTKSAVISSLSGAYLDIRRTPKVKRLSPGKYLYLLKNCDTGHFQESWEIVKLTPENIAYFQELRLSMDSN